MEWFGTVVSILGAFLVGMTFYALGYTLFIIGAVSWLCIAYDRKDNALGVLNVFFLAANMIGLYNAI